MRLKTKNHLYLIMHLMFNNRIKKKFIYIENEKSLGAATEKKHKINMY